VDVAVYRVVQYAPAVILWQPTDQNGEPVAAVGTPTVVVTRADGTAIAITPTLSSGVVSLSLTSTHTASLDKLSVIWSLDAVARGETTVDVVGGRIASLAELRARQAPHLDVAVVNNATLALRRDEIESWFEQVCNRSFVPRFDVYWHPAARYRSKLFLPHFDVRRVRWARSISANIATALPVTDIDVNSTLGIITNTWGQGVAVEVGYEHGLDEPPDDIVSAVAIAVRLAVASPRIRVDQFGQAIEGFSDPDAGTVSNTLKRWQADPVMVA